MFGSAKDLLLWIAGTLVVAGIPILAVIFIVDSFIDPYNPSDPLASQGGLQQQQDIRR